MKRATIIIAVMEAIVLLVMKLMDLKESKQQKPRASKARRAAGHRVVNPSSAEYDGGSTQGDKDAAYLPASSGSADEKIHKEE